jgi:hypothetical protein
MSSRPPNTARSIVHSRSSRLSGTLRSRSSARRWPQPTFSASYSHSNSTSHRFSLDRSLSSITLNMSRAGPRR